ncbi:rDNA-binding RNA polymerase I transcriptional factor [Cyberlindnera jadinii NRRL Y-1542]|uniref:RNA polymerase I-specific transcription initiation factor RRN3 n=1 Tax=Cyberlindnera jadinii (strain ATCC 18201 / CBS 1600 / BCRC 20928 / JCM 3617 / NBRC 0987 / NRRL Y-1542) TaxID=983966 RepID=A0A1E4S3H5_CYBJN|nr:RNA polymerase I-specific transcription initiation factor RRN3 [Cyberlindnera jadinii NRRL Y-1542]ODV74069.1 RNA polymerase I-specific transcription initiation factor RRN3 [Cyberlindnera jadinii NRRL Y-1542]
MYKSYIKSALESLDSAANGAATTSASTSAVQLDTLASQISLPRSHPEAIKPKNLSVILIILTNNISKLDSKGANAILLAIINYHKWYTLDSAVIGVFKRFIMTLCSYLPKWWSEISSILIGQFTLAVSKTEYHHEMLRYFIKTIPTSIPSITKQLVKGFPNKHNSKNDIVNYVSNLLLLNDYCPELRFNIWSLIVERCIQIDVELQNELDDLDDDSEFEDDLDDDEGEESCDDDHDDDDESDATVKDAKRVHFEDPDESDSDEDEMIEEEETNEHEIQVANITDLSDKLDSILSLTFSNLQGVRMDSDDEDEEEQAISIYNTLTSLFKTHILPTYYTKSTQFILFYYTQQSPELMDSFLVTLIDLCFASDDSIEKRIKSLQYLSSYISRAKMLQKSQILFVISYLMSWLNRYVEEREVEIDVTVNMDRFKLFYSTFQVLLYVFCFRHSLFKNEDCSWELSLDKFFQRMLITKFNPLKFCNETVVSMFAKIAQEENVAYCFSIIQKNKNERLRGISGHGNSNESNRSASVQLAHQQFVDLEGYFPFDPLFLKTARGYLKELYIEWSSIAKEYESDTDVDDLANEAKEVIRRNSMALGSDEDE